MMDNSSTSDNYDYIICLKCDVTKKVWRNLIVNSNEPILCPGCYTDNHQWAIHAYNRCCVCEIEFCCKCLESRQDDNYNHIYNEIVQGEEYEKYCDMIYSMKCDITEVPDKYYTKKLIMIAIEKDPYAEFYFVKQDIETCMRAVNNYGLILRYVRNQTEEICYNAIMNNINAFKFVRNKTRKLCIDAVRRSNYHLYDVSVFEDIKIEDKEMCLEILEINGMILQYVKGDLRIDKDVCLTAVKQNGKALKFVDDNLREDEDICTAAVSSYGKALKYINNRSKKIYFTAIRHTPKALKYMSDHNISYYEDLCLEAVRKDPLCLMYVKQPTRRICMEAVSIDGSTIEFVEEQDPEMCMIAVRNKVDAFLSVRNKTPELCTEVIKLCKSLLSCSKYVNNYERICFEAIKINGLALEHVQFKSYRMCLEAVKNNGLALQYVGNNFNNDPIICSEAIKNNIQAVRYINAADIQRNRTLMYIFGFMNIILLIMRYIF